MTVVRSLSHDLATRAIQDGTMQVSPRSREEESALAWMHSTDLARNSLLLQNAITAVTTLSQPASARHEGAAWSKRQRLLSAGWSSTSGRHASAHRRVLNACQSKEYYTLLMDSADAVCFLENTGKFSHAQGVHYYATVQTMIANPNFRTNAAAKIIHW